MSNVKKIVAILSLAAVMLTGADMAGLTGSDAGVVRAERDCC